MGRDMGDDTLGLPASGHNIQELFMKIDELIVFAAQVARESGSSPTTIRFQLNVEDQIVSRPIKVIAAKITAGELGILPPAGIRRSESERR
jgi:hypothetical protein